mgnify:CR=1 FL=1
MNNKGMTLVELLVTFSLLLVIIVGMFNLIMEVKNDFDDKRIGKDFTEYSSNMNSSIQYDLIKNKPFAILYKNNASDPWTSVSTRVGYDFASSDNNTTYVAKYSGMSSENINPTKECQGIYPCLIYAYVDGNEILTKTIGLNKGDLSKSDVLAKSGIYYNDVFESIPNQEFVDIQDSSSFSTDEDDEKNDGTVITKVEIKCDDETRMLVINFPYRLVEHDENYGFKIVYPFFVQEVS